MLVLVQARYWAIIASDVPDTCLVKITMGAVALCIQLQDRVGTVRPICFG